MIQDASTSSRSNQEAPIIDYARNRPKLMQNMVFPLYDQISIHTSIHPIISIIVLIFVTLQVLYTSMWRVDGTSNDIFNKMAMFILFRAKTRYYQFLVWFILIVIFLVYPLIQVILFKKYRKFFTRALYPVRFLTEDFPLIMMHPISNFMGHLLVDISTGEVTAAEIVYFSWGIIEIILIFCTFAFTFMLLGSSPYLTAFPFAALKIKPFVCFILINVFFEMTSIATSIFPIWVHYLLVAGHLVCQIRFFYLFIFRPFLSNVMNVYMLMLTLLAFLLDTFHLICYFFRDISDIIYLGVSIGLICVSVITCIIFYRFQNRKLYSLLNEYDEDIEILSEDRHEFFRTLGIGDDENKSTLYLCFCIQTLSEYIKDFSLLKYVLQYQRTTTKLAECIKITSFFPGEIRLMNIIFNEFIQHKTLKLYDHFLIFQIMRLKFLRQSSASLTSAEQLKRMIQISKEIEIDVRTFWTRPDTNERFLSKLSARIRQTKSLWNESILEFPNSATHSENYCEFLVECCTDFQGAIKQKHRADCIESGKSFAKDICFQRFIKQFPNYLKKRVVDIKGNIIKIRKTQSSREGTTQAEQLDLSSSLSTLDGMIEENIGKTLVSQVRLRLALQATTNSKKAKASKNLLRTMVFNFMLMIVASTFVFAYFHNYFAGRGKINDRTKLSNEVRFNLYAASFSLIMTIIDEHGLFNYDTILSKYWSVDDQFNLEWIFDFAAGWRNNTIRFNVDTRDVLSEFYASIAALAAEGYNVYDLTENVFDEVLYLTYCNKAGYPVEPVNVNFKTIVSYIIVGQAVITINSNSTSWFESMGQFCTVMKTMETFDDAFVQIRTSLLEYNTQEYESYKLIIITIISILGPAIFLITFVPLVVILVIFYRELDQFVHILTTFDVEAKKTAMKPLLRSNDDNEEQLVGSDKSKDGNRLWLILVAMFAAITIFVAIVEVQLYLNILLTNRELENLNFWIDNARRRKSLTLEMMSYTVEAILLNYSGIPKSHFTDYNTAMNVVVMNFDNFDDANSKLLDENGDIPSIIGFDPEIDDIMMNEKCQSNQDNHDYHELYMCGSSQQLLSFFREMVIETVMKLGTFNGRIDTTPPIHMLHIVSSHLIPTLIIIDDKLERIGTRILAKFDRDEIFYYIAELALSIAIFAATSVVRHYLDQCYDVILMVMRRLSPLDIVLSKPLMKYLLNRSTETNTTTNTTSGMIVHSSSDSIILTQLNGVVDMINPAVTFLLGYTPEQLLGQPLSVVIKAEEQEKILKVLEMMQNHESPPIFEDHITCIADDETEIPCFATILGMSDSSGTEISSFVVCVRDESSLIQQQKEAELAKKKSESLLYQILPRDVVIRLNQGEKDITYTVQSATIMFIDIVKFSEYAASLSPAEIMGNLSFVFGAFDDIMKKYSLLYKIKLIGDVYMCAGGLFDPDEPPASHAEQTIKFGLDCLQTLEDINLKLNAILNVRIGVNTGGPIIGGVLGTDKPVFDIIGDPINIASRLQSTDYPGSIQISEYTYNLVSELDFLIEPRGEVFLKGKGKLQAYLVKQNKGMIFQFSSNEASGIKGIFSVPSTSHTTDL